jgi:hypothetical protein
LRGNRSAAKVRVEGGLSVLVNKPLRRQLLQQRLRVLQVARLETLIATGEIVIAQTTADSKQERSWIERNLL